MNYRFLLLTIILSVVCFHINGQQIAAYSFDGCTFSDQLGNFTEATAISTPACECGLLGDALYFDGNNDNLNFPTELDTLLEEDFSISFYFRIASALGRTDIISMRSECALDSFFSVTYNPIDETISFDLAENISNFQTISTPLNTDRCWHRAVITKSDLRYNFYLDDELAASVLTNGLVRFSNKARLSLSNSPCIVLNEDRFNGWIDEFNVYNRALSAIEIISNSLNPDEIVTRDTTILTGASVQINTGATCAESFSWSPTGSLDFPDELDPIATPDMTTEYRLTINNSNGCSTTDSITINVIDPADVDCSNIFIPNAFTPNNDLLNDQFGVSSLYLVEDIEYFEIYDRWGAKMWESNVKSGTWDGSFRGQKVNPGMYIYKIKYTCNGTSYVKVDNFSVLR